MGNRALEDTSFMNSEIFIVINNNIKLLIDTIVYIGSENFKTKHWSTVNRHWECSVLTIGPLVYKRVSSPSHVPVNCGSALRKENVSVHCRTKEDGKQGSGEDHIYPLEQNLGQFLKDKY